MMSVPAVTTEQMRPPLFPEPGSKEGIDPDEAVKDAETIVRRAKL